MRIRLGLRTVLMATVLAAIACGDDDGDNTDNTNDGNGGDQVTGFESVSCADFTGTCSQFESTDTQGLLTALNTLSNDTTIVFGSGTFDLNVPIEILGVSGITLIGQGMDSTTLDFSSQMVEGDGIKVTIDNFRIEGLTILESVGDSLRVEDSTGVVIRAVRATWSNVADTNNGDYGLYPVRSTDVLMEDSEASNAADAGIYIGQSQNVIIRNNTVTANVAGLEIENTQFADVFNNTATGNTAGIVVFDLPGNPIIGRDVRIHDNVINGNNGVNFGTPGTVVAQIPPGVGSFVLASRRIEFFDNTYENNNTTDIAVLSGLTIEDDVSLWTILKDDVVGSVSDLNLMETPDGSAYMNFRTEEILIRDNTFGAGGASPGGTLDGQPLGFLLAVIYGQTDVDSIIYDTIGESGFSATEAGENSNVNVICLDNNTGAEFGSLDLATQQSALEGGSFPTAEDLYRPASPFSPFDCNTLTAGPVEAVTIQ